MAKARTYKYKWYGGRATYIGRVILPTTSFSTGIHRKSRGLAWLDARSMRRHIIKPITVIDRAKLVASGIRQACRWCNSKLTMFWYGRNHAKLKRNQEVTAEENQEME